MNKSKDDKSGNSLIKFAQYISGLAPNQDALEEAGKALVSFMNVNALVFAKPDDNNRILFSYPAYQNKSAENKCAKLFTPSGKDLSKPNKNNQGFEQLIKETYESGFFNTTHLDLPDPVCFGFFPVAEENKIRYVLVIANLKSDSFSKEELDEFLAIAALIGNISGRLRNEKELREHRWRLEKLVAERTDEIQQKNVLLTKEIEQRKKAETKVEHLNKVLRSINNVNQMMIRETDPDKMLEKICETLVNSRGYYNAWIAWLDNDRKLIKAVEAGVGERFNLMVEKLKSGNLTNCQQMALKSKEDEVIVINDPNKQCSDCPLSSSYRKRGAMIVAIRHGKEQYGLLAVSLPLHFVSEEEERVLLAEVAGDIAFALHDKELQKAHDIAVKETRVNERRLSQIVQGNSIATFVIDKNHTITHWNEAAEKLTGMPAKEMLGTKNQWKAFYNEERPVLADVIITKNPRSLLNKYYKDKYNKSSLLRNVYEAEDHFPKLGKNGKWLYFTATPLKDEEGNITGALETLQDYTNRKTAEQDLLKTVALNQATLESTDNGILVIDYNKKVLISNRRFQELWKIPDELMKKGKDNEMIAFVVDQLEDPDAFLTKVEYLYKNPAESCLDYVHFIDGRIYQRYSQSMFINNEPHARVWSFRDITALKKHEIDLEKLNKELSAQNEEFLTMNEELEQVNEALSKAKEKAVESDRLKSAFLANMSHEIRTPMNGILGFADLLKEPELTGEAQKKYVNIIQRSGERMLNIINDLISISKIESGQMELILSETNINEVIDYLFAFFKPETDLKGLQLSVKNTMPVKEAEIITDKEKLFAILTNLIKNAIKYTHKGSIEFGYHQKGDELEFFVSDTGIGIPEDKLESVFDRFVQVDHRLSSDYEGAGLGLAITKSYVEMLGGKIWVKSGKNISGSVFSFTIPYNKKQKRIEKIGKEIDSLKNQNPMKNLTILIAEDEESSDLYLTELLKNKCKALLHATTGEEAVNICMENQDVDLVLLDIKMPVMDGYEAAGLIKKINKDIIIIAQTAYALTGDREKALAAGCDEYIKKPLKKIDLLKLIEKHSLPGKPSH